MKRAATAVLTVVGLTLVLVGVMSAVLLGARGEWRAEGRVAEGARAVVVKPALAAVLGPRVSVRAETADPAVPLFVGRASADDARALASGTNSAQVVGLDGTRRLDVRTSSGTAALPAPATVDVWQQSTEGTGTAGLAWTPSPGAQSFVVTRADGAPLPAVELTMSWRDADWRLLPVVPLLFGAVLLVAARLLRQRPKGRAEVAR